MTERETLRAAVREMSDDELRETAERLRGNPKRDSRRKMTEAEIRAYWEVTDEITRRGIGVRVVINQHLLELDFREDVEAANDMATVLNGLIQAEFPWAQAMNGPFAEVVRVSASGETG